jgi:hypothetical protein
MSERPGPYPGLDRGQTRAKRLCDSRLVIGIGRQRMTATSITDVFILMLISGDPAFVAVMRAIIAAHPDHALTVCEPAAALSALRTQVPTLILVDADPLPAPEAAVSLMAVCADVPVAAISAARRLSLADTTALYKAGAVSVLFKSGGSSGMGLLRNDQLLEQLHTIADAARAAAKENAA